MTATTIFFKLIILPHLCNPLTVPARALNYLMALCMYTTSWKAIHIVSYDSVRPDKCIATQLSVNVPEVQLLPCTQRIMLTTGK